MFRKVRISDCWVWVAVSGYVAARECRKVQVERPRSSTSGGHSGLVVGAWEELLVAVEAAVVMDLGIVTEEDGVEASPGWDWDLLCDCGCNCACLESARHDAADVQRRHLLHRLVRMSHSWSLEESIHTVCHLYPGPCLWADCPWSPRPGYVLAPALCVLDFCLTEHSKHNVESAPGSRVLV